MADTADTRVKDIGSRPVGYTLADDAGVVDLRLNTKEEAQAVLTKMQKLVPPLMTSGHVIPIRGVIKERGRKPNTAHGDSATTRASKPDGASAAPDVTAKPAVARG